MLIRMRDFRGEEEVDSYGAHVSFCVIRKEEEKKKKEYEKNGSLFKKKNKAKSGYSECVHGSFFSRFSTPPLT